MVVRHQRRTSLQFNNSISAPMSLHLWMLLDLSTVENRIVTTSWGCLLPLPPGQFCPSKTLSG